MLVFLISGLAPILTRAASEDQRFHDDQVRRQQQIEAEREKRFDARPDAIGPAMPIAQETTADENQPCFVASEVRLELINGSHAPADWKDEFSWVENRLEDVLGRCLGQGALNRLIRQLTDEAIIRGRTTTRFTFPSQDFSRGLLRIAIAPGLVSSIRFADSESGGSWKTALSSRPGDYFDLRAIEQAVEQFGRLGSIDTTFDLLPGEGVGESEILIRRQSRRPWRINVSLDDGGVRAAGRYNTYATMTYDDPLGINDLLSVTAGSGTLIQGLGQSSHSGSLAYSVPYAYSTLSIYLSAYDYRQAVQGAFQKFIRAGRTRAVEVSFNHVLRRTQSSRTGIDFRIARKKSAQFIDDVEIEVQRRNTTSLQLGLSHRHYIGTAVLDGTFAVRKGGDWLGATPDDIDLPPGSPSSRYAMEILDISFSMPFTIHSLPLHYRFSAHGQRTKDLVLGTEFMSIGGRQTVRGFDSEHSLAAERGWFARNELAIQMSGAWPEIYFAFDMGAVGGPSTAMLPGTQLAGASIGLRKAIGNVRFEFFAGTPVRQPARFASDRFTSGFQLAASF